MRPKAPTAGEKYSWRGSDALGKPVFFSKGNGTEYVQVQKAVFMTVVVAGCSALLLAGFGLSDP